MLLAALVMSLTTAGPASAFALADAGASRGWLVKVEDLGVPSTATMPLEQMTREQLIAEQRRLENEKPGIGGAITCIALGGVATFAGLITLYVTFLVSVGFGATVPLVPLAIGIGLALGGAGVVVLGVIMLVSSIRERRVFSDEIDRIQQRLDGTQDPAQVPERSNDPLPPPPPPPPAAGFTPVQPGILVATF